MSLGEFIENHKSSDEVTISLDCFAFACLLSYILLERMKINKFRSVKYKFTEANFNCLPEGWRGCLEWEQGEGGGGSVLSCGDHVQWVVKYNEGFCGMTQEGILFKKKLSN